MRKRRLCLFGKIFIERYYSMTIGYLGPEGSYSQLAAQSFSGAVRPYSSFFALFEAIGRGEADAIVLPVENSLNGGVMQNLDLLQSSEGLVANREVVVRIDHRLLTLKGADHAAITRIYSHPQALGQCARYLNAFFPEAELIATASTSAAVSMVRTPADAGIVGPLPVGDKFELSPCTISDEPRNYTQFLLVERGAPDFTRPSKKVFLSFSCLHRPGSLIGALSAFASAGINMTRIESRPIKDRRGEYRFFVEIEADASLAQTRSALRSLEDMCSSIKILGCY